MPTRRTNPVGVLHPLFFAFSSLLLAFFSHIAHAVPLRIDAAASAVTYKPPSFEFCSFDPVLGLICSPAAPPEVFTIAGDIDVEVINEHLDFGFGFPPVDRTLLQLRTRNLTSGALAHGFWLPGGLGLMTGDAFEVSDDPCFLFVGPGSCSGWIIGTRTGSVGIWDGATLVWSGYQTSVFDSFTFRITARAIPEPGTWLLLILAMLSLVGCRGGRKGVTS